MSRRTGKVWWSAESLDEALTWAKEIIERGALAVELRPLVGYQQVDLFVTMFRADANKVADYEVEESEWMDGGVSYENLGRLCDLGSGED